MYTRLNVKRRRNLLMPYKVIDLLTQEPFMAIVVN